MLRRISRFLDKITPGIARSLGWETVLAGLSFPASIMLNRALGAEQRGMLALAMLVPTTIFTLGGCQWDRIARGAITSRALTAREAWRRTCRYVVPLSLMFVPLGIIASLTYPSIEGDARWLSALYTFNFPIYFLGGTLQTIFLANGHIEAQYRARLSMQGSYLVLLGAALVSGFLGLHSIIGIYFLIHVVSLVVALRFRTVCLSGEVGDGAPPYRPLLAALPPLVAESIAGRADMWAFSMFGSLSGIGQYSGLSALMLPVGLVSNAMLSSSVARLDWTDGARVRSYLKRASLVLGALCFCVVTVSVLVGPSILNLLLGKTFAVGGWMFPWVALVMVLQTTAHQFHSSVQLSGHTRSFLLIQSVDSGLRLALVLGAAAIWGELGILLGLTCASLVKALWSGYALVTEDPKPGKF